MCQGRTRSPIVSHAMWQTRFGGAADAIGKTLLVNGVLLEIVGVTQKSFTGIEAEQRRRVASLVDGRTSRLVRR